MRDLLHETISIQMAELNGWEYVSTERQKKNGTNAFKIGDAIYQHTTSGYLRCIRENPSHWLGYCPVNRSIIAGTSGSNRISFIDAIRYLNKRFGKKENESCGG